LFSVLCFLCVSVYVWFTTLKARSKKNPACSSACLRPGTPVLRQTELSIDRVDRPQPHRTRVCAKMPFAVRDILTFARDWVLSQ
jgi:hypothetical protein